MKLGTIGVIAPSTPLKSLSEVETAVKHCNDYGIRTQFYLDENKIQAFYEAQADEVDLVMAARGGFNVVEILPKLNFELIKKPLCGYSDITVLLNAVLAKTGKVQFLGPNFKALNRDVDNYTIENLIKIITDNEFTYNVSKIWKDPHQDNDMPNLSKAIVVNEGQAEGYLVGGNLCSQIMLCGTEYYPIYDKMIVVAEEDDLCQEYSLNMFLRNLWALFQYPFAKNIKGLVIGRFMKNSKVDTQKLVEELRKLEFLQKIPVVCNIDTGHTMPQITLPLGQKVVVDTQSKCMLYGTTNVSQSKSA